MTTAKREIHYLVLQDATEPFLLARVRWPDVYQAISPVRRDWQDDPGLFDLPYEPSSTKISQEAAAQLATEWGADLPSEDETQPSGLSLIRRLPSDWSSISTAERRAWAIDSRPDKSAAKQARAEAKATKAAAKADAKAAAKAAAEHSARPTAVPVMAPVVAEIVAESETSSRTGAPVALSGATSMWTSRRRRDAAGTIGAARPSAADAVSVDRDESLDPELAESRESALASVDRG